MATQARIAMRAVRTLAGTPIPRYHRGEAGSSTWKRGSLVYLASGYLTICGADPALIAGVATADAGNAAVGTVKQLIELAHPDTLFRGYLDTSGGGGEGAGAGAETDIGVPYGVALNAASGKWYVDKSETTNDRVVIWQAWDEPGYTITDTMPHVLFSFILAYCQMYVAVA